jgi:C4-dicarboxylate transporter, DctM subunit
VDIFVVFDVIILVGALILGVPVALSFFLAVLFIVMVHPIETSMLLPMAYSKLSSITILAIPFFIIAGGLMGTSGIADRLVNFADSMVGNLKGGVGMTSVVACAIFGAISGTASSGCAAIGSIMIPKMVQAGYSPGYATALVSCSSVLVQLIPPSVPMIIYGWVTYTSVTACFLSTVIPGIICIVLYCVINYFYTRNMDVKTRPYLGAWQQTKGVALAGKHGVLALLLPVIVLGGVYGGFTTPTESATLAVVYALPVGILAYRLLKWRDVKFTLSDSLTTTGAIIAMVFTVIMLARVYTMLNVPQQIVHTLVGVSDNPMVILLMVNVFLLILGMLIDDFSGTLLAAPLLMPVMQQIGIHPVHFAAILGTNLGLGNLTPPMAPILYLGARVGKVRFDQMIKPAVAFMIFGNLPVVIVTTYFPDLSLFLPRLILGIK